jgi:uncharacterized protein YjbJ (UPF0337 family)
MERNQVKRAAVEKKAAAKSTAKTTKGKVETAAGKALGDRKLTAKGKLDEVKGKTARTAQRVKKTLES